LRVHLDSKHHPDKHTGQHDDGQTQYADSVKGMDELFSPRQSPKEPSERLVAKQRKIAEIGKAIGTVFSNSPKPTADFVLDFLNDGRFSFGHWLEADGREAVFKNTSHGSPAF